MAKVLELQLQHPHVTARETEGPRVSGPGFEFGSKECQINILSALPREGRVRSTQEKKREQRNSNLLNAYYVPSMVSVNECSLPSTPNSSSLM